MVEQGTDNSAIGAEEEELFVAVGNAAKVARGLKSFSVLENETNSAESSDTNEAVVEGAEEVNEVVCAANTITTSSNSSSTTTLEANSISNTADGGGLAAYSADVVDDDEADYVVGVEEESTAYKNECAATLCQSEHKIQQQQQHPPQTEGLAAAAEAQRSSSNEKASKVGPFLDQTWNWLRYFLVTILLLNLKRLFGQIANRLGNGDDKPVVVSESVVGDTRKNEQCAQVVNGEAGEETVENNLNSGNCDAGENMSPNTCSIQNQEEVEKAEEAIMAVGIGQQQAEEKPEVVSATPEVRKEKEAEGENQQQQQQQQQITIVLPSDDQVVVVSGEEGASSLSEDDSNDLAGIRRDSVDSYVSSEGSGNLGDIEAEICDKSSEDGGSSVSGGNLDEADGKVETAQKIIAQVESMFSDEHLAKDGFLLKHVRRRSDGFVSLKLVAGLRKVKQISREFPVVLDALKDSKKLEINSDGTKVRRVDPLTPALKSLPIKSKDKDGKESKGKDASSNDENQQPAIQQNNKSRSGNKENSENGKHGGNTSRRNSNANTGNQSRRNSNSHQQPQGGNHHPHHRKSSNTSTASSNNSSRHNSFSKAAGVPPTSALQQHPADLFRNVYMATYSSSGEESQSPQVGRRRGGSLPVAALHRASHNAGGAYLSPNSSPPNGTLILGPNGARPKSNSYCEGASPTTMSPWLQRRKASASTRLSSGELSFNGVIRQPRGPDGTKGFATGYRAMILEERLQQQQNSAVSA